MITYEEMQARLFQAEHKVRELQGALGLLESTCGERWLDVNSPIRQYARSLSPGDLRYVHVPQPVMATHIGWDYLDNGAIVAMYVVPVPEKIAPRLYIWLPQESF